MPSQTIHIPTEDYQYALETMSDDETISSRLSDLVSKGIEAENAD